jgi:hypothetical protein
MADTEVSLQTATDAFKVVVAGGATKTVAAVSGSGVFGSSVILPVHHISDISGAAGQAIAALKDAIIMDMVGSDNSLRISGSVQATLAAGTQLDVQTVAEAANGLVTSVEDLTGGLKKLVPVHGSSQTVAELQKSLSVIIVNRSSNPVYIKLHATGSAAPVEADFASATSYNYVLESYGTYEAVQPNAKLWHSVSGSAEAGAAVALTITKQD